MPVRVEQGPWPGTCTHQSFGGVALGYGSSRFDSFWKSFFLKFCSFFFFFMYSVFLLNGYSVISGSYIVSRTVEVEVAPSYRHFGESLTDVSCGTRCALRPSSSPGPTPPSVWALPTVRRRPWATRRFTVKYGFNTFLIKNTHRFSVFVFCCLLLSSITQ